MYSHDRCTQRTLTVCVFTPFILGAYTSPTVLALQLGLHKVDVTQEEGHTGDTPPFFRGACVDFHRKQGSAFSYSRR